MVTLGYFDKEVIKVRWMSGDLEFLKNGFKQGYQIELLETDVFGNEISSNTFNISPVDSNELKQELNLPLDSAAYFIYQELMNSSGIFDEPQHKEWQKITLLVGVQENFILAKTLGLAFELPNVDTTHIYRFKITLNGMFSGNTGRIGLRYPTALPLVPLEPPIAVCDDNLISLTGYMESVSNHYGSFQVEKQDAENQEFKRINELPLIVNYESGQGLIYFRDSIRQMGTTQYRFRGKDIWGRLGPPSEPTLIEPCHLLYVGPHPFSAVETSSRGETQLLWEMPDTLQSLIKGFWVYRTNEKFGKYELLNDVILPSTSRQYLDDSPIRVGYYVVEVQYLNNRKIRSLSIPVALIDTRPPAVPQGLILDFDTSEFIATLHWDRNTEEDFSGYRIYFAYDGEKQKKLLYNLEIEGNTFKDTIAKNLLHNKIYYWVTTRDYNQNESWFSDSVLVNIPDRFPPIAPTIVSLGHKFQQIDIHWHASPSTDIEKYLIQRRLASNSAWENILKIDNTVEAEIISSDNNLMKSDTPNYRIVAVDTNGLSSVSEIKLGWLAPDIYLPTVDYFSAEKTDTSIILFFDYDASIDIFRFKILAGEQETNVVTHSFAYPETEMIRQEVTKTDRRGLFNLYKIELLGQNLELKYFQIVAVSNGGKVSPHSAVKQIN